MKGFYNTVWLPTKRIYEHEWFNKNCLKKSYLSKFGNW